MAKVKKIILITLIAICFIIPFLWSCFELLALWPVDKKAVPLPHGARWIGYFGIFLDSGYVFNETDKTFIDKASNRIITIDDFYISDEDFISKNEKSTDTVIKALVKWRQNFDYVKSDNGSTYYPANDASLKKHVASLGIKYVPHMFYYSKHSNTLTYGNELRYCIDYLLKRNTEVYGLYDLKNWETGLLKDLESIPSRVEKGNIDDLGLLPLPYLFNQLKKAQADGANTEKYISLLPGLAVNIYNDIFTDYNNKDAEWWLKWADNFDTEISAISTFIELAEKYCQAETSNN